MKNLFFAILCVLSFASVGAAQNVLEVVSTSTTHGGNVTLAVALTNDTPVQGYQAAISYDNSILTLTNTDFVGTAVDSILSPQTIEFFTMTDDAAIAPGMGWAAAAAIFDFQPPFDGQILPAGVGRSVVFFTFTTANDMNLIGTTTPIILENGMGSPPLFNIVTVSGTTVLVDRVDGGITFIDQPLFKRGDANGDGFVNLADAISLIQYFFNDGATPGCLAAADANGDTLNDISDSIFLIQFQFLDGAFPSAPYPDCGTDPAGSEGPSCNTYSGC